MSQLIQSLRSLWTSHLSTQPGQPVCSCNPNLVEEKQSSDAEHRMQAPPPPIFIPQLEKPQPRSRFHTTTNQKSPLLLLPTELRLQIYSYLNLTSHIIEIKTSAAIVIPNDSSCPIHPFLPCQQQRLWYRLELRTDEQWAHPPADAFGRQPAEISRAKRKRYGGLQALFPVSQVCRQLRDETRMKVVEGNGFAFSRGGYDYVDGIELFVQSLTVRERSVIRCIYWPLSHARDLYHANTKQPMSPPRDPAVCVDALRSLTGLKKVVLRYVATDVGGAILSAGETEEMKEVWGWDYVAEKRFRRELAVRGLKALLVDKEVEIVCEKTWRAGF